MPTKQLSYTIETPNSHDPTLNFPVLKLNHFFPIKQSELQQNERGEEGKTPN